MSKCQLGNTIPEKPFGGEEISDAFGARTGGRVWALPGEVDAAARILRRGPFN
jgi:hypothetical protein